jgi:hypothetical protein
VAPLVAADTLPDAAEREPGGHEQRHHRKGREEEHGHEDELLRIRRAVPELEVDSRDDRVQDHEARDQQRVGVRLPRHQEKRRARRDQEADSEDRARKPLTVRQRLRMPFAGSTNQCHRRVH